MRLKLLSLFALFAFISIQPATAAEDLVPYAGATYNGEIGFTMRNLPTFEQYPATETPADIAKDVLWASNAKSRNYKRELKDALKKGPNFAGKYVITTTNCGKACQANWIIDAETGRIVNRIDTTYGIQFKPDSKLLIAGLPQGDPTRIDPYASGSADRKISFYILEAGKLAVAAQIAFPAMNVAGASQKTR